MARPKIYSADSDFFSKIDNQEKAYWLGYLFADGSIQQRGPNSKILQLNSIDREHLAKFKSSLEFTGPIKETSYTKGSFKQGGTIGTISIRDCKIVDDLATNGCIPRKTFNLKFPPLLKDLEPHFIRGYFDGDGCISNYFSSVKGKECINISIAGIEKFLEEIVKKVFDERKYLYKDKRKETDCWNIKINGDSTCLEFLEYIYKDAEIYLDRKKKKFEYFLQRRSTTIIGKS